MSRYREDETATIQKVHKGWIVVTKENYQLVTRTFDLFYKAAEHIEKHFSINNPPAGGPEH